MSKKVMAAMSGGVDSSVAAAILKEQGFDVCGATLKLFSNDDIDDTDKPTRTCCSLSDVEDARQVARKMGFEHFVFNFGDEFKKCVMSKFINSYIKGLTPNPCIDCNRYIKFSKLLERAKVLGNDYIATGHYAQIEFDEKSGRYLMKKAVDLSKDQTYVLYAMTQDELAHTLFPLGALLKSEVREMAQQRGLINARKPDSQDICFVPDGDYAGFIERSLGRKAQKGKFTDCRGNVLGEHEGVIRYTIGQRKGLGITFGEPRYVVAKNAADNTVTLGKHEELFSDKLTACDANWIMIESLTEPMKVQAKTRYKQNAVGAVISPLEGGRVLCCFDEPQRAVTSGQAVVFYSGDYVVGGATIE